MKRTILIYTKSDERLCDNRWHESSLACFELSKVAVLIGYYRSTCEAGGGRVHHIIYQHIVIIVSFLFLPTIYYIFYHIFFSYPPPLPCPFHAPRALVARLEKLLTDQGPGPRSALCSLRFEHHGSTITDHGSWGLGLGPR